MDGPGNFIIIIFVLLSSKSIKNVTKCISSVPFSIYPAHVIIVKNLAEKSWMENHNRDGKIKNETLLHSTSAAPI